MGSELISILTDFGDVALTTILLGYWVWRKEQKIESLEAEIKDLNDYSRISDKEDIKTLNEFSRFLESLIAKMDVLKDSIARDIAESARAIKSHINERISNGNNAS